MNTFKVGDIVTGETNNDYVFTTSAAIMRVLSVNGDTLDVTILSHKVFPQQVEQEYTVSAMQFMLAEAQCASCGQRLPEKPILIGSNTVEFKKDGVQVGCTFVPAETVRLIASRLETK